MTQTGSLIYFFLLYLDSKKCHYFAIWRFFLSHESLRIAKNQEMFYKLFYGHGKNKFFLYAA
jgi:hypothetical protein